METSAPRRRGKKRAPQRAVPQSIRRSGKPLFFGWGAHLTHHEREQVKERVAAAMGIVIALLVVGILAYGWYWQNISVPAAAAAARNKPVAVVGGVTITKGWYNKVRGYQKTQLDNTIGQYEQQISADQASKSKAKRSEASVLQSYLTQLQQEQGTIAQQTFQELIDGQVIEQKGPAKGLHFGPAAQAAYFKKFYKQVGGKLAFQIDAQRFGLSAAQLKSVLLLQVLGSKMQTVLAKQVAKTQFEVHVRHILIGPATTEKTTLGAKKYAKLVARDHALAITVQHELQHGGSWDKLAYTYSQDSGSNGHKGSQAKGGDYGWVGASTYDSYVAPYKYAALHQKLHVIDIIHSQFGYHVFQVLGRGPRPLTKSQLTTARQGALQTWLSKEEAIKGYVQKLYTPPASPSSLGATGLPTSTVP